MYRFIWYVPLNLSWLFVFLCPPCFYYIAHQQKRKHVQDNGATVRVSRICVKSDNSGDFLGPMFILSKGQKLDTETCVGHSPAHVGKC